MIKDPEENVLVPEPATRKVAKMQELESSKKESKISQISSRSLDTDSTWETESISSRYETYDVFHVDEVMNNVYEFPISQLKVKEKHSASLEMLCVNLPVEQPSLVSCGGKSLLEEVWFDCESNLIEEQVSKDDLQELETIAEVCQVDLSMQGVGETLPSRARRDAR
ncbi:hypothetical protein GOP47_0004518 [Adiantum capillus-veneris]|uniref:Uncharacterized protein n=1 Tax=Adiantum capillus-veneris TaxID=13818 RepID=A0A9D4V8E0_ADICA|nr:hypothetical protein GOP47_0004518 [Adiantum capillus-veneris]